MRGWYTLNASLNQVKEFLEVGIDTIDPQRVKMVEMKQDQRDLYVMVVRFKEV